VTQPYLSQRLAQRRVPRVLQTVSGRVPERLRDGGRRVALLRRKYRFTKLIDRVQKLREQARDVTSSTIIELLIS